MSLSLISAANAATSAPGPQQGMGSMFFILIIVTGFFYFILWRPQSKRAKEQRELVNGLQKGDEVVTNAGIYGKISKVSDETVIVTVADNVELKLQKAAVTSVLPKGTIKSI